MSGFVPVGNTQLLAVSGTAANVAFAPSTSNTFRVSNSDAANSAFVGVYNSATVAANVAVPTAGTPYPGVVYVGPGESVEVGGNFGAQNTSTIYVAGISGATANVYVTPISN